MMLISPITEKWMKGFVLKPQTTLLVDCQGDLNAGLQISQYIYESLLLEKNNPQIIINSDVKSSIGIEEIRNLKKSLSLRANKKEGISRYVVINDASTLTVEAQNSLLKIIEELPKNTLIILVASNKSVIIQTVRSRCFTIPVLPITAKQATLFAKHNNFDSSLAIKMFNLSEGKASEYMSLLNNENESGLQEIELAKSFLKGSVIERQSIIEKVSSKDHDIVHFIKALNITAKAGMHHSRTAEASNYWKNILITILNTETQVKQNVGSKLALLSLSVSL